MDDYLSLIGRKFENVTILDIHYKQNKLGYEIAFATGQCDCGKLKEFKLSNLKSGQTKSCGCVSRTRLSRIWYGMKTRCYNSTDKDFTNYGGRGIIVCVEWRNNFQSFHDWALCNNYSDKLSIDRINNNGNYEPSNCRFATREEQADNRRNNILITIGDETKTLQQWCDIYCIPYPTVYDRMLKYGTNYEKLFIPNPNNKLFMFNGISKTLPEWSRVYNIKYHTVYARVYKSNWSLDKALTTPVGDSWGEWLQ